MSSMKTESSFYGIPGRPVVVLVCPWYVWYVITLCVVPIGENKDGIFWSCQYNCREQTVPEVC